MQRTVSHEKEISEARLGYSAKGLHSAQLPDAGKNTR